MSQTRASIPYVTAFTPQENEWESVKVGPELTLYTAKRG